MNRVLPSFIVWAVVISLHWTNIAAKGVIRPDRNPVLQKDTVAGDYTEDAYIIVEEMPVFGEKDAKKKDGAMETFQKYVNDNVVYPADAKKSKKKRRVFIQFEVDEQGDVVNVKVVRSAEPALDAEAVRVVSSSPRWTPGRRRGKPVRVRFVVPVEFKQP